MILGLVLALAACSGETLPDDVVGYKSCLKLNAEELPQKDDDPHVGVKNVYACNVTEADLVTADGEPIVPYREGTLIVKEATRKSEGQDYPWLVATARKEGGAWTWKEYTRNFPGEDFVRIPVAEAVCVDCHAKVKGVDYIYTVLQKN